MVRRTAILAVLVALGACSQGRKLEKAEETASNTACTRCHGGADNDTGAPPGSMRGATATTDRGVGAHSAHVEAGAFAGAFPCTTCHPDPRSGSTAHGNGQIDVAFSGVATPAPGAPAPSYVPETGACSSVYCHGAFHGGNDANAPVWTNVGSGAGACGTCHGLPPPAPHPVVSDLSRCRICHSESIDATGKVLGASVGGKHLDGQVQSSGHGADWMNPASDRFHAFAANADLLSCGECHGSDLSGGQVGVGCGKCHDVGLPAGVASWKDNCVMCHGRTDNGTGAPPRTIRGQSADAVRVGAHTVHVSGSAIAPAFGCEVCHPKPADALAPGHVNGSRADVAFAGVSVQGLTATPSWSPASRTCAVYCHGATMSGGSSSSPDWTGGASQATCGSCHGLPPLAPHPAITGGLAACAGCHPQTITSAGQLIAPSAGGKHLDGILEVTSAHGASWMDPTSTAFHAYSVNQGLAACQGCHGQALNALPGGNCANCHGGAAWATRCTMCHGGDGGDQTGAPPKATYGNAGDAVRIGAHRAHVGGGGRSYDCAECHVKPASAFTAGHIGADTTATVTFGSLAKQGVATPPAWDRTTRTCSNTYCHGTTLPGGTLHTPDWTAGAGQAACGACHASPPQSYVRGGQQIAHPQTNSCAGCHGAGYSLAGVTAATHVDGKVDILQMTCTSCHGDASRQGPASAAPPVDTKGNVDPAVAGVGAHLAHVQNGPLRVAMACSDCHVVPTSVTHPNNVKDFSWSALATDNGATTPSYNSTSRGCSATYCHGSTLGAGGSNHAPTWTGGAPQAACGTCHGAPPPLPHPNNTNCGGCHGAGYSATAVNPATHVDGKLDVGNLGCTSCHGDSSKAATPQDPLNAAPPTDTSGGTARAGAHQAHLRRSALACTECHVVPTSLGHSDLSVQLTFGPLARKGGSNPTWNPTTKTCSNVACHSIPAGTYTYTVWDYGSDTPIQVTVPYGGTGSTETPSWYATGLTCNACHGNPPRDYPYTWHSGSHGGGNQCELCHPDAVSSGGVATGLNTAMNCGPNRNQSCAAFHANGTLDVIPQWTGSCSGCH